MMTVQRTRFGFGLQLRTWAFGFGLDFDPDDDEDEPMEWYAWAGFGPFIIDLTRFAARYVE